MAKAKGKNKKHTVRFYRDFKVFATSEEEAINIGRQLLADNYLKDKRDVSIFTAFVTAPEEPITLMYQPDLNHATVSLEIVKGNFNSFDVFRNRKTAEQAFPGVKIYEYKTGDIEEPRFVDNIYP